MGGTGRRLCCVDSFHSAAYLSGDKGELTAPSRDRAAFRATGSDRVDGTGDVERRTGRTNRKCQPLKIPRLRPDAVQNIRRFGGPRQQIGRRSVQSGGSLRADQELASEKLHQAAHLHGNSAQLHGMWNATHDNQTSQQRRRVTMECHRPSQSPGRTSGSFTS